MANNAKNACFVAFDADLATFMLQWYPLKSMPRTAVEGTDQAEY